MRETMMRRRIRWIGVMLFFGGALNFMFFWEIGVGIGGTADKVVDGRYYVSSHGESKEVSPELYKYILIHERITFVTHPLALLGAFLAFIGKAKEDHKSMTRGDWVVFLFGGALGAVAGVVPLFLLPMDNAGRLGAMLAVPMVMLLCGAIAGHVVHGLEE